MRNLAKKLSTCGQIFRINVKIGSIKNDSENEKKPPGSTGVGAPIDSVQTVANTVNRQSEDYWPLMALYSIEFIIGCHQSNLSWQHYNISIDYRQRKNLSFSVWCSPFF
ncbi:hypothetical protein EEL32_00045 (plasmid) [Brevibacillus laterosporus]|nr:hypothetical protein EEL32_00045 [Brevibacillus laterosporus]